MYYLGMKVPTLTRIVTLEGYQKITRDCYLNIAKRTFHIAFAAQMEAYYCQCR